MRLLPNSSHVEMTEGGVWSLPFDHPDGGLEWRLRYANPEQLVKDRFLAASVVDCYRTLIMLPEKRRRSVIRRRGDPVRAQDLGTVRVLGGRVFGKKPAQQSHFPSVFQKAA